MSNSFVHKIWVGIIDRAEKRGRFTDYDKERAMDWNCCAVGERDQACDKLIDGLPDSQDAIAQSTLTDRAYTLGTQFYNNAVLHDDFKKARQIMIQIGKMRKGSFYRND